MAKITGENLYVAFKAVVISGEQRSLNPKRKSNFADTTAGAQTGETSLGTTTTVDLDFEFLYNNDAAGTAARRQLYEGNYGTVEWAPEGTASGKPKYSCLAWVESVDPKIGYKDEVSYKVSFRRDGDWITDYESLGSTY